MHIWLIMEKVVIIKAHFLNNLIVYIIYMTHNDGLKWAKLSRILIPMKHKKKTLTTGYNLLSVKVWVEVFFQMRINE